MADCVDNFILSVFLLNRRKSRQGPCLVRLSKMLKMNSTSWYLDLVEKRVADVI